MKNPLKSSLRSLLLMVCLLMTAALLTSSALAQEATAEPVAAAVGSTAAQPPSQSEAFTLILSLIEKAGYIIAFYFLFKSVPADKVKEVMETAAADAKKTETPVDDLVAGFGKMLADALVKAQNTPKPGETVLTSTSVITEPPSVPRFEAQAPG